MEEPERGAKGRLILSMMIFGSIGVFRRFISLSSSWLACTRGVIGTVFLLVVLCLSNKHMDKKAIRKNRLPLLISGAAIGMNWIFLFEAYRYTTVAVATLCYYMAPVFVIFLAPLLLKEKLTVKKAVCALLALLGMLLVSGIFEKSAAVAGSGRGIFFGLCAAAFYAAAILTNKLLKEIASYDRTVIQLGIAALVTLPYALLTSDSRELLLLSMPQLLLLIAVGVLHTGVAYWLYFGSMKQLSSQTVAVYSYIDPAFAVLLSVALLREETSLYGIIGAVLILGSTLFCEWKGKKG